MNCCGTSMLVNGQGSGSGGGSAREFLFTITTDRTSTAVFPVIDSMVAATIPAGALANDGDMITMYLSGTVVNVGAGARTISPFVLIDAVNGWGATSANIPNAGGPFAWLLDILITRKSATTFALGGHAFVNNVTTAIAGIGSLALANLGGPISSPAVNPACVWANAQTLFFNMTSSLAGVTTTIKTGYAEVLRP